MRRREIPPATFLASLPLFKALDAATLERLAAATERRTLRRGERVFGKGDRPTGMYLVVYGEVRLFARSPTRGERLTGVVRPGSSFGEPVMFLERPALVDAEAAADTLLLHLPKEAVFAEIAQDPEFARRIIGALAQRVEGLVQELDRQALGSGRARLVDFLLREVAAGGQECVVLPASKAAIASHLNLTAEHFSRLLRELSGDGLIRVEGRRIHLLDLPRLKRQARPPTMAR